MNLTCSRCGGRIARQRGPGAPRKFCESCSPTRVRTDRGRKQPARPSSLTPGERTPASGVYGATLAELQAANVHESVSGVCALIMAARIDSDEETATGLVALIKELRATLADALSRAEHTEMSPLEEIRARRLLQLPVDQHTRR